MSESAKNKPASIADARLRRSPVSFAAKVQGFIGFWLVLISLLGWWAVGSAARNWAIVGLVLGVAGIIVGIALNWKGFKEVLAGRHARHGAVVIVSTGLLLMLLVIVNYGAARHWARADASRHQQLKLEPPTVKLLQSIDKPVRIWVNFAPEARDPQLENILQVNRRLRDMLAEYEQAQPLIDVQHISATSDMEALHQFFLNSKLKDYWPMPNNSVIVYQNDDGVERMAMLDWQRLAVLGRNAATKETFIRDYTIQAQLSAALRRVVLKQHKIYFLTGHGELPTDAQARPNIHPFMRDLVWWGYGVDVLPGEVTAMPADASLLISAGPTKAFSARERQVIGRYLDDGGKLLVTLRSRFLVPERDHRGAVELLERYGVRAGVEAITVGEDGKPMQYRSKGLGITRERERQFIEWLKTREIVYPPSAAMATMRGHDGWRSQPLVVGATSVYGETAFDAADFAQNSFERNKDYAHGIRMVMLSHRPGYPQSGEVLTLASSLVLTQPVYSAANNRTLVLHGVATLLNVEANMGIQPRENLEGRVVVSEEERFLLANITFALGPVIVFALGLGVWFMRRR